MQDIVIPVGDYLGWIGLDINVLKSRILAMHFSTGQSSATDIVRLKDFQVAFSLSSLLIKRISNRGSCRKGRASKSDGTLNFTNTLTVTDMQSQQVVFRGRIVWLLLV